MNKPMFGLNQNSGVSDGWLLPYVSDGRLLVIETEETGSVSFFDRMNSLIVSEMTTSGLMFVPENAYRIKIDTMGEYQFLLFEPDELEIAVDYPEIITIGDIIQMNVSITNMFDFASKMSQERLDHMWDIDSPNLELYISQNQNSIQLSDQQTVDNSIIGQVDNAIETSYSIDSNQLAIGVNLISFELNSDWHGELGLDVQVNVFDKVNTVPEITGPTYLEFNQSNGSAFWTYDISDIDEEVLTISLGEEVNGLEIGPTTIDSSGTLGVNWIFSDLEEEDYTVTIVVEDQESRVEYTTTLKLIFEEIVPEDVLGCSDLTALNYNELVTVDDGSCQYEEVTQDNETNQTVVEDDDSQTNQSGGDNETPNDESKSSSGDDNTMMYSIIGIIVVLLLGIMMITLRVSKSSSLKDSNQFDINEEFNDISYQNHFPSPTNTVNQNTNFVASITTPPEVQEPTTPARVDSYMQLTGGGEYTTDQRGVIYTDPSGIEWVQLGDGSFIRIN